MSQGEAVGGARTSTGPSGRIRPLVGAVIRDGERILVWTDVDPSSGEAVAVPIAGGIEFGETSADAVRREVEEELGSRPAEVRFLGVLEDVFEWAGQPRHELWLVYDVELSDRTVYERDEITIVEPDGETYAARWRDLREFESGGRLVPTGLLDLIV
jgi:ADP-ribose pyrophosphatase YjhB (NUDIX family)